MCYTPRARALRQRSQLYTSQVIGIMVKGVRVKETSGREKNEKNLKVQRFSLHKLHIFSEQKNSARWLFAV